MPVTVSAPPDPPVLLVKLAVPAEPTEIDAPDCIWSAPALASVNVPPDRLIELPSVMLPPVRVSEVPALVLIAPAAVCVMPLVADNVRLLVANRVEIAGPPIVTSSVAV